MVAETPPSGSTMASTSKEDFIGLISPLSAEILKEFVHRCADELCGRKGPSEEKFCSPCSWTSRQFHQAVSGMKTFLTECIVHSYNRDKIEKDLLLSESQINGLMNCISVRRDDLQLSLLNHFQNHNSEVLSDHDWKIKWVMGSSSLSSLQETLLQLDLTTVKENALALSEKRHSQLGRIGVELTCENVSMLINTLEKAQESLT